MPNTKPVGLQRPLKVGCHPGIFHADEVFAIAALKQLAPDLQVIRSRDPEDWKKADLLVDVGQEYNPLEGKYDHHQEGFAQYHPAPNWKYTRGPKKSGFGLIWDAYGRDVIRQVIDTRLQENDLPLTDKQIDAIWEQVRKGLVVSIDMIDNGQASEFAMNWGPYRAPTINKLIDALNPIWIEAENNLGTNKEFETAISVATMYLIRDIIRAYGVELAREEILDLVASASRILIMDRYRPWSPIFTSEKDKTRHIELVVYPANEGWMVQTPYGAGRYEPRYRTPIPEFLRGQPSEKLMELAGNPAITFAHPAGFLAAFMDRDGALQFAEWLLKYKDQHPEYNPLPPPPEEQPNRSHTQRRF